MKKDQGKGGKKGQKKTTTKKPSGSAAPLRVLSGAHNKAVTALAFAPDGQTLASGGDDKTVRLWDAGSGEPCACGVMNKAPWGIAEIVFSPDGRAVAAVSRGLNHPVKGDTRVFLWDLIKRSSVALQYDRPELCGPAFSPDGTLGLVGGGVRLFDSVGKETGVLPKPDKGDRIAFAPDGAWVVFGNWQGPLHVLNVEKRMEAYKLQGHTDNITALAFSPDGRWLASSSSSHGQEWEPRNEDRSIRLWDFKKRKQVRCWARGWETTACLTFLADSRRLVSFHDPHGEARVNLWTVDGEEPLVGWAPRGGASSVAVWSTTSAGHGVSGLIATGYTDGTVKIWDIGAVMPAAGVDPVMLEKSAPKPEPAKQKAPTPATTKRDKQNLAEYDEYFPS